MGDDIRTKKSMSITLPLRGELLDIQLLFPLLIRQKLDQGQPETLRVRGVAQLHRSHRRHLLGVKSSPMQTSRYMPNSRKQFFCR
jgi:hypothetical protein